MDPEGFVMIKILILGEYLMYNITILLIQVCYCLGGKIYMGFWIFMLIMDLLIPLSMIGFGHLFSKKVPQSINYVFGYRTSMSMKNNDTWVFAHHYCGNLWLRWGKILLPVSILTMCFSIGKDIDTIGKIGAIICFVQMIPLAGVIIPTERALRKTFDKNGKTK